uniref:Sugar transporter SWEET n=1 Tax=Haemonchus contortus TaxID=6289 RepID=A0A7I4YDL1_HAECO|nr:MtN3 saliva-related transmembrane protein domain containing protein [Haemonchus contortus]
MNQSDPNMTSSSPMSRLYWSTIDKIRSQMTIADEILPYLSVSAICTTIGLFLCGIQICLRIRERGTTEGTGSAPFLIAFISCAFWLQYGVLKHDNVVIFVNIVGFMLQGCYLSYYFFMTRNTRLLRKVIGLEFIAIGLMLYAVNYGGFKDNGRETLGAICVILNIASIGAPLFQIGEVIRTKNSESLPLPLCLACFAVSLQWLLYGLLVHDIVIQVPNYIATLLSVIQLSLFVIYPRRPTFIEMEDPLYTVNKRINHDM